MYVVETLPRAGTQMLYQFGTGKVHRAVIDSGIVMTNCGQRRVLPNARNDFRFLKKADPNKDTFSMNVIPYQGQSYRCEKCR